MMVRATLSDQNLVERVDAVIPNAVVGDLPVEVTYSDYRDFGGVKFPTRIRQSAGGFPTLDLTVTDVKANGPVDIQVPDAVRQATNVYGRVATQMVADGVWYLTGGSHHSVVIEMKDHLIVVEGPLNERAGDGRDRRGAKPGAEQADQVRGRQPPSLRSLRWAPDLRRRGRDRHHSRQQPCLPRAGAGGTRHRPARQHGEVGPQAGGRRRARQDGC